MAGRLRVRCGGDGPFVGAVGRSAETRENAHIGPCNLGRCAPEAVPPHRACNHLILYSGV